jgi:antitoxin component YwqK of YwqJK toxin-antitoxin module
MKYLIPVLCAAALLCGCAKKVGFDDLEKRDGLRYFEGKPFTGVAVRKYKNGQKWFEDNYKDGRQHGLSTSWYENGQKNEETTYKDGKQHGLYTSWYDNGQKEKEATFKDGKELGPVTGWYGFYVPHGQEWFEDAFKEGKEHGPVTGWYGWYENGQKSYEYEATFKDGKLHGRYTEWYENGQKREEITRKDGKILSRKKWDEDGGIVPQM